jgi:ribosome maturation protein Sdo1
VSAKSVISKTPEATAWPWQLTAQKRRQMSSREAEKTVAVKVQEALTAASTHDKETYFRALKAAAVDKSFKRRARAQTEQVLKDAI